MTPLKCQFLYPLMVIVFILHDLRETDWHGIYERSFMCSFQILFTHLRPYSLVGKEP